MDTVRAEKEPAIDQALPADGTMAAYCDETGCSAATRSKRVENCKTPHPAREAGPASITVTRRVSACTQSAPEGGAARSTGWAGTTNPAGNLLHNMAPELVHWPRQRNRTGLARRRRPGPCWRPAPEAPRCRSPVVRPYSSLSTLRCLHDFERCWQKGKFVLGARHRRAGKRRKELSEPHGYLPAGDKATRSGQPC